MQWKRPGGQRLSRRRFLGLAGAAGAGGLLAACGSKSAIRPQVTSQATGDGPPATATRPRPAASATPLSSRHGETLRYTGFVVSDGVFDPHRTAAGPFTGQQALVFSRLLAYANQAEGSLAPDLATVLPEQPDPLTYVFTLNANARWQKREPLNGRQLTSDDVRYSIVRQRDGDPGFLQKPRWLLIDSIDLPDPLHVVVRLKEPNAPMLNAFADVNAFVVPHEVAESSAWGVNQQVGSGPFLWVEWDEAASASVSRNPDWHAVGDRPFLDGVDLLQPKDADEIEAHLRTKKLDVAFLGRPQADRLMARIPELQEATVGHTLFFGMRFYTPVTPYNDVRFRTAVSIALDRTDLVQRLFAGSGESSPWVSWPLARWTLPRPQLENVPGYRPGADGRAKDIAEAKAMLTAYANEKPVPAELGLIVLEDTEATLGLGAVIRRQLAETLGLNVVVSPKPLPDIAQRLLTGNAPWAAGPDIGPLDLDDWLYPYFHSAGTKNSFALRNTDLDTLIVKQRTELDPVQRQEIGYQVQRQLISLNAGVNLVSEKVVALSWPYVRAFPLDITDGFQHRFADCWIDRGDASFRGR